MTRQHSLTPWRIAVLTITFLSGVLYAGAMTGTFIWDDQSIMAGWAIGGGNSLRDCFTHPFLTNYYRPLVSASFYLERSLSGHTPFFYHQTNVLLHMAATAFFIALLWEAFRRHDIAAGGGLLFAVQPVQVSAVAWIGGRTDSQCVLAVIVFAWALIRAARATGRASAGWLGVAVTAYALALFTKEQTLALLPLVPLAYRCWQPANGAAVSCLEKQPGNEASAAGRGWRAALPFLIVGIVFITLHLRYVPLPSSAGVSRTETILQTARTITYYMLLLLAPAPRWMHTLSLGTLVRQGMWPIVTGVVFVGVTPWLFVRWLRREPALAWFLALTVLSLFMVSNIVPVPSMLVTPYRAAVAGIGVAALLGRLLGRRETVLERHAHDRETSFVFARPPHAAQVAWQPIALALFVFWCGGLTIWGASLWRDEETMASTIVRYDPDSIWARYNLTSVYLNSHRHARAVKEMETILDRLFGSSVWRTERGALAAVQNDRGLLQRVHEEQGTRIDPTEWLAVLYGRLGFSYLEMKQFDRAEALFRIGGALNIMCVDVTAGLGECAYDKGHLTEATRWLRMAVLTDPSQERARLTLGKAYAAQGKWAAARREFRTVIERVPWGSNAYIELANMQIRIGDTAGAAETLAEAARRTLAHQEFQERLARLQRSGGEPSGKGS